jgi:adenylosuccinate lyase
LNPYSLLKFTIDKHNEILDKIIDNFSIEDAERVKEIEATTNHDVKAVEYFLKEKFDEHEFLKKRKEFLHFTCTSEDINNLSYAIMVNNAIKEVMLPKLESLISKIENMAHEYADIPMMSRTHGQSATPTTVGKELANFAYRVNRQIKEIKDITPLGKFNGAVGNFNAHIVVFPDLDWQEISQRFVESLGIAYNPYSTQIEPHDSIAQISNSFSLANTILIDFARDMWGYISLGYFKQQTIKGEVGSSTMPHKVNPINFENGEGNLGLANAMFGFFTSKLPISRFQRDLSDSTVMRNIGVAFAYSIGAYAALERGMARIEVNKEVLLEELEDHYELLAEVIQTVMRKFEIENPYEKLKEFTRGKNVNKADFVDFINKLELPEKEKEQLLELTPAKYIGLAPELAKNVNSS